MVSVSCWVCQSQQPYTLQHIANFVQCPNVDTSQLRSISSFKSLSRWHLMEFNHKDKFSNILSQFAEALKMPLETHNMFHFLLSLS